MENNINITKKPKNNMESGSMKAIYFFNVYSYSNFNIFEISRKVSER